MVSSLGSAWKLFFFSFLKLAYYVCLSLRVQRSLGLQGFGLFGFRVFLGFGDEGCFAGFFWLVVVKHVSSLSVTKGYSVFEVP